MRIAIAGAGAVGQSIAGALLGLGHKVLLIERNRQNYLPNEVPAADWLLADACELGSLEAAGIDGCGVVIATTGDDKVNLVFSLLSKTEFSVPRVVARVNDPRNEWLFTETWGVDIAVSTPRTLVAAVEEAVSVGGLVKLMTLHQGQGSIVEITLPADAPAAGRQVKDLTLPAGAALLTILRTGQVIIPQSDSWLEAGDELVFVTTADVEQQIRAAFDKKPLTT
jgi:trk system potassium uptake protein TrkA